MLNHLLDLLRVGAWLVLVLSFSAGPVAATTALTDGRPEGLPREQDTANWDVVTGQAEDEAGAVVYRMFVNPSHDTYYTLSQYRYTRHGPDGRTVETEKLIWDRNPGSREPLLCFERVDGRWVTIASGSARHREEMFRLVWVYMVHRRSLTPGP